MIAKRMALSVIFFITIFHCNKVMSQEELFGNVERDFESKSLNTFSLKAIRLYSGLTLEYAEKGFATGIPVIFLHGYTDSWHSFDQVLPFLPDSIHAFFISQRGHGESDRPQAGYSPEDFAVDIAEFMQELKLGPAIIVGHSMGATVAQRFGLDYPYLVKSMVLVGSFASFKSNPGMQEFHPIISKISDPVDSGFVNEFQKSTLFNPVPASYFRTYVQESLKVPARVWKAVAKESLNVDYTEQFKNLSMPVLIVWGDKDVLSLRADQYILASSIRKSTLLIYEGVGHAVHWEVPQKFAGDLLRFINTSVENVALIDETQANSAFLTRSFY